MSSLNGYCCSLGQTRCKEVRLFELIIKTKQEEINTLKCRQPCRMGGGGRGCMGGKGGGREGVYGGEGGGEGLAISFF